MNAKSGGLFGGMELPVQGKKKSGPQRTRSHTKEDLEINSFVAVPHNLALDVGEEGHEAEVHVELLVAVE